MFRFEYLNYPHLKLSYQSVFKGPSKLIMRMTWIYLNKIVHTRVGTKMLLTIVGKSEQTLSRFYTGQM